MLKKLIKSLNFKRVYRVICCKKKAIGQCIEFDIRAVFL